MTLREALKTGERRLHEAGIAEYRHDAMALLSFTIEKEAAEVFLSGGLLSDAEAAAYEALIGRRAGRYPLQYLTGEAYFMGLTFTVNESVLIPRFDTETVCEQALSGLKPGARVLDIGTGSGALAVAIKARRADCTVAATDLSRAALALARRNAERNRAEVLFYEGDLFAGAPGRYDLIVSNPPYIPRADMALLQPEVAYEPTLALDGGEDGLDLYRRIIREAPDHLLEGGRLVLEIGDGERDALVALTAERFQAVSVADDLDGMARALVASRPKGAHDV